MITATFNNDVTTVYKGTRAVKAAWIIKNKTGEVVTGGYSMSASTAQKTAENKCSEIVTLLDPTANVEHNFYWIGRSPKYLSGESRKYLIKKVREAGLADDVERGKLTAVEAFRRAKEATKAFNAKGRAAAIIEISTDLA